MDRNTANVSFYCRESKKNKDGLAPIELSLVINKKRCFIQLPRKERPSDFKRAFSTKRRNDLKDYLDLIRSRLYTIETQLLKEGQPLTAHILKQYFRAGGYEVYTVGNLFDDYMALLAKRVGKDLTAKTYRKYEIARDKFYMIISPDECDQYFQCDYHGLFSFHEYNSRLCDSEWLLPENKNSCSVWHQQQSYQDQSIY